MKTDKLLWYKFFQEHGCEYRWEKDYEHNCDMCIVWLSFFTINSFLEEIGDPYDDFNEDGGIECKWQGTDFAIDFVPICEYYDIPIEKIFEK